MRPRVVFQVAEGVRKYGGHYQAALSWAVYNPDPSIYNVQWAVDFFRECVAMGTCARVCVRAHDESDARVLCFVKHDAHFTAMAPDG